MPLLLKLQQQLPPAFLGPRGAPRLATASKKLEICATPRDRPGAACIGREKREAEEVGEENSTKTVEPQRQSNFFELGVRNCLHSLTSCLSLSLKPSRGAFSPVRATGKQNEDNHRDARWRASRLCCQGPGEEQGSFRSGSNPRSDGAGEEVAWCVFCFLPTRSAALVLLSMGLVPPLTIRRRKSSW